VPPRDTDPKLLAMRGICKSFGSSRVLDDVSLELRPGEIVGLMGANGAGKSTLIKILAGVYVADAGEIELDGERVASLAGRAEVGIIHQDLGLVDSQSVLDNVRLGAGRMSALGPLLHRRAEIRAAERALAAVEMDDVSVFDSVGDLTPGQKALLAIARLLERGARIVVVDETTASLPPKEARWFLAKLREAAERGTAVVMVSHKLGEIRDTADRLVLLADGSVTADTPMSELPSEEEIARLLLGEEAEELIHEAATHRADEHGATVLRMRAAETGSVGPVDLELRRGEVVGLTGRAGSGLHEVGLMAAGTLRPDRGSVEVEGSPRRALLPPQREVDGAFAQLPSLWNMTLAALGRWRGAARLLRLGSERAAAESMVDRLRIVPPDLDVAIGSLSGGNQQKVLFARAMLQEPDVFVLCEPTRGVDLRTRREIYRLIGALKREGRALLVVTSDVEDALAVCDRIGTVNDGRVSALRDAADATDTTLAEML
jgi:ribose transport system ATP-binding protein